MELELLSPLDSDDSIHEDTEIEIATVMDQIALLNPEGKCRAWCAGNKRLPTV